MGRSDSAALWGIRKKLTWTNVLLAIIAVCCIIITIELTNNPSNLLNSYII